jgi:integrase
MRDFDTIDSELRLLVAVRRTVQEPDGRTASTRLIRKTDKRRVYLSAEDVRRLADESGEHRALVLLLAYCGLRWGEAIGLRVRDVEFLRRRLAVHENAVQLGVWHAVVARRDQLGEAERWWRQAADAGDK